MDINEIRGFINEIEKISKHMNPNMNIDISINMEDNCEIKNVKGPIKRPSEHSYVIPRDIIDVENWELRFKQMVLDVEKWISARVGADARITNNECTLEKRIERVLSQKSYRDIIELYLTTLKSIDGDRWKECDAIVKAVDKTVSVARVFSFFRDEKPFYNGINKFSWMKKTDEIEYIMRIKMNRPSNADMKFFKMLILYDDIHCNAIKPGDTYDWVHHQVFVSKDGE